jgi:hypothetical protein
MKRISGIVLGGCAVAALVLIGSTSADARCTRASAMGYGLGPEMAKEMAKMNLDAGVASKGMKARGRVAYKCTMPVMTECKAVQRAC